MEQEPEESFEVVEKAAPAPHSLASAIHGSRALHRVQDHFSLEVPSSNIRFRSSKNTVKVFSSSSSQFVLEEDVDNSGNRTIVAKKMNDTSGALQGLRATYTLVTLFFTGFLLVFCLELLLFLVIDLTVECGATNKSDVNVSRAIGVLLSLPVYVRGLASALVIAGHYVKDTWNGHPLVKRFVFGSFNGVLTEWISFFIFLGIPVLVMAGALFSGYDYWWSITSLTWFSCVFAFYLIFAATIVWFENRACLDIMKNRYNDDDDSYPQLFKRSVLLRQTAKFSGSQQTVYLASGTIQDSAGEDQSGHLVEANHHTTMSFFSKLTTSKYLSTDGGLGLFKKLEEPIRTYTVEDARGVRPFVTAKNWSLEKLYCRPRNSRYVAMIKGPESLTVSQMRSSFVCAIIGNMMVLLLLAGALVWLGLPAGGVALIVMLVLIFGMIPGFRVSYRIYQLTKDIAFAMKNNQKTDEVDEEEEESVRKFKEDASEGVYQVWETYRVTCATARLCWLFYVFECLLFFIYPAVSLFFIGNYAIAILFLFVAVFSGLREFLNAALVLEEVGNMDLIRGTTSQEKWLKQSRLNTIIKDISRSRSQGAWTSLLCIFLLAFLGLFGLAISQQSDTSSDFEFTYMPNFEYIQAADLAYPTCTIGKGIESLGSSQTAIADFAFVAVLAYRAPNITQGQLNQWFGNSTGNETAVDMQDLVNTYRAENDVTSAVSYKLIVFPTSNLALVSVRGTTNAWDALTDAQLWSSAGLFQFLRLLLPLGTIWTPILDVMVQMVSWLESASIERVAFYKQTTAFVQYLKNSSMYDNVQITGHSLGGGLSIITGAQTDTPAVALSGPNALISRNTFNPPLTIEALNNVVFNIIPDRDIVPRLDDVARLFQKIDCTAPNNDFAGCHDGRRSLCEIIFTCGTRDRPALCDCVIEFGYPEPTPKAGVTETFQEVCASLIESSGWVPPS